MPLFTLNILEGPLLSTDWKWSWISCQHRNNKDSTYQEILYRLPLFCWITYPSVLLAGGNNNDDLYQHTVYWLTYWLSLSNLEPFFLLPGLLLGNHWLNKARKQCCLRFSCLLNLQMLYWENKSYSFTKQFNILSKDRSLWWRNNVQLSCR